MSIPEILPNLTWHRTERFKQRIEAVCDLYRAVAKGESPRAHEVLHILVSLETKRPLSLTTLGKLSGEDLSNGLQAIDLQARDTIPPSGAVTNGLHLLHSFLERYATQLPPALVKELNPYLAHAIASED